MLPRMPRNLVLIRVPFEEKDKIIVPEEYKNANINNVGQVVVVGKECKELEVGDTAYFRLGFGNKIIDDSMPQDAHYIIISETDLIAFFKKEDIKKPLVN